MTKNLWPAVAILAALYMAWCSGKSAGASHQKAHDADAAVSAVRDSNDRWKARYLARDSARDDSLDQLARANAALNQRVARLAARAAPRDYQSLGRDSLIAENVVKDSAIAALEAQHAADDSTHRATVTLFRAMLADRDSLLARKDRQIAALETARDAWRRAASPNVFQKVGRAVPWIAAGYIAAKLLK